VFFFSFFCALGGICVGGFFFSAIYLVGHSLMILLCIIVIQNMLGSYRY